MENKNFGEEPILTIYESDKSYELGDSMRDILKNEKQENYIEPPKVIIKKKEKKQLSLSDKIKKQINEMFAPAKKYKTKEKTLVIICLFLILLNFLIKLYIFIIMLISLFHNFIKLKDYIRLYLIKNWLASIYYMIDFLFLNFGLICFLIEPLYQLVVRIKLLANPNEFSLKPLIMSKIFYFISLGLIPEVAFSMFLFQNKNNVVISFFSLKLYIQPYILFSFLIYWLFIIFRKSDKPITDQLMDAVLYFYDLIKKFFDNYVFLWNNFQEHVPSSKKDEKSNNKNLNSPDKKDNEEQNNLNISKEIENETPNEELETPGEEIQNNEENLFKKMKKKATITLENTSKITKSILFIDKIKNFFKKIKNILIILFLLSIFISPILNGIFTYGFYIFAFKDTLGCIFFKIDIFITFIYGYILILLIN